MSIVKNQYETIDLPATVHALDERIAALEEAVFGKPEEEKPKPKGKKSE